MFFEPIFKIVVDSGRQDASAKFVLIASREPNAITCPTLIVDATV
jgi:hypothetical protein